MNIQKKLAISYVRTKLTLLSVLHKRSAGKEAFRLFCTPLGRYNGKEAEVFKNANRLQFDLNHTTIRGYECNPRGTKTMLLLHGFSSTCHKFDQYAIGLIKKGYRVLAFDAPAHGASDGKTVNALEYCNMIIEVARLYGPIDAYLGHSFGGIAVSLALEKIPHSSLTKLVLIAPATETSSAVDGALSFLQVTNPRVKEALNAYIYMVGNQETSWYSIRRAIKNIKASVLWIHDEEDDITPFADALKVKEENHSTIQFIVTRGLGHQRIYRDAKVKAAVLDFL